MIGRHEGESSFGSRPVPIKADGSFVTERLNPEMYVFELIRTPHSPSKPATSVGLRLVSLGDSDVSNVTLEVQKDTTLTGIFRMESDNPNPVWPSAIVVNAHLAVEGMTFLGSTVAEGAYGGKFVLRNVFGPRILRSGYTLGPGTRWWGSQVMLDGVDITNVPTDFSAHANARLEVVFSDHPPRIRGTVTDASGQPVRAPWILAAAAEPALRQHWSTMLEVTQGNTRGEFSIRVAPGRYLVAAFSQETFDSYQAARKNILPLTSDGMPVQVTPRETKDVTIPVRHR